MSEQLKDNGGEKLTEKAVDDGPWGKRYQQTVPPFNSEQKQSEPSSAEVIDALYDRYANQLANEEANRDAGLPSLSEEDFTNLKFRLDIIKKVFVKERTATHDEGFSYSSYFENLRTAALDEFQLRSDDAKINVLDDGSIYVGNYQYGTGNIGADELYTTLGSNREGLSREQLLGIAETCAELTSDADSLERDLDRSVGFGYKIRPKQETASMTEHRDYEHQEEQRRRRYEEDIRKYGPEIYSEGIITSDKLDEYKKEKEVYIARSQVPHKEKDGVFGVYAPDEEKIKEYDELIESEKRKIGEEEDVWKELRFENGETHANDAISELNQFIDSLVAQIDDAKKSGAITSEKTVRELKRKQAAARRLVKKIQEYKA